MLGWVGWLAIKDTLPETDIYRHWKPVSCLSLPVFKVELLVSRAVYFARWWLQVLLIFTPTWGNLTTIFRMGSIPPTNQLVYVKIITNPKIGLKKTVMECFDRIFQTI